MVFKGWEKTNIISDDGRRVQAINPIIVSASRSTDIPAFHHKWFYNRLNKGHVTWTNPFNRAKQYVSFAKTRVFVFWTKNPERFMLRLKELDQRNYNYYFQFTLNDYEREGLEPGLPSFNRRFEVFKRLADQIGKEKVIWRFDPLILTDRISLHDLTDKLSIIASRVKDHTEKLVTSFADIEGYKKVSRNLKKAEVNWRNFTEDEILKMADILKKIGGEFNLKIATCAEKVDLSEYGIEHNKCVDDALMVKLFPNDKKLMKFLGYSETSNSLFPDFLKNDEKKLKDKGQRKDCGCIVSKDLGQYNTCKHMCTYCYANDSENTVRRNFSESIDETCESILCR